MAKKYKSPLLPILRMTLYKPESAALIGYTVPFLAYIVSGPVLMLLFKDTLLVSLLRLILLLVFLYTYRAYYLVKPVLSVGGVLVGVLVFLVWVGLEGYYPKLSYASSAVEPALAWLMLRLVTSVMIAPVVEEVFTRDFLLRMITSRDIRRVPIGRFTVPSFILTTLFFGFSHSRWLPGLISGVLLNILLYRSRHIGACVTAHAVANLLLAVYVIATGSWQFW